VIAGSWTSNLASTYVVEVDEFFNPILGNDNLHIEMRFESYNAAGTILD
jgi:hypothetical protein